MIREFPVDDSLNLRAQAEQWRQGTREPAAPRSAATVMFVRDGAGGVEVFMLRRVSTMAFAPSAMVFPGGGVDPRDADPEVPWAGPSPQEWAARLDTDEATARELVAAAVREVFEECGVLLAGPSPDAVIADVSGPHWHRERERLLAREKSLSQVLVEHDLVLRSDLLAYRSHWITPEFEPRRYDTRFFAAAVPQGQTADDRTSEADHADWVEATEVLERLRRGEVAMLPPTIVSVEEIAGAPTAAAFIAEDVPVAPVMPVLDDSGERLFMRAELPR